MWMYFGDLIVDIVKSGTVALVMTKIAKSIGEADISEIIKASGWTIVGVDTIKLTIPFCKGVEVICGNIGEFFEKLVEVADKINIFN